MKERRRVRQRRRIEEEEGKRGIGQRLPIKKFSSQFVVEETLVKGSNGMDVQFN